VALSPQKIFPVISLASAKIGKDKRHEQIMRHSEYREQDFERCCGKCCFMGSIPSLEHYLLCLQGVSRETIDEYCYMDSGDQLDKFWSAHLVDWFGICPLFEEGEPSDYGRLN